MRITTLGMKKFFAWGILKLIWFMKSYKELFFLVEKVFIQFMNSRTKYLAVQYYLKAEFVFFK